MQLLANCGGGRASLFHAGSDTYVLGNGADVVSDASGTDTVTSTISRDLSVGGLAAIEDLTLLGSGTATGTGNALNNDLVGNSGANTLSGGGRQ